MTNKTVAIKIDFDGRSDYSLQLNRWFLKPIGAWPSFPSTSRLERIMSFVLIVICYIILICTIIPCLLHIILENESFRIKLRLIGPVSYLCVGSINYTTLLLRGKDIRYCVEHMQADWRTVKREKDQQVMLKNAKFGRYVTASTAAFMQGGVFCYCFMTALSTEVIQVGNETRIVHQLPYVIYKELIDINESPTNEIILFMQFLTGFIVSSSTLGILSITVVLIAHACGQLNVVMTWITEFVNESKKEKIAPFENIGIIVERHLRTLRYSVLYRSYMFLFVFFYYIVTEWSDGDIQILSTYSMLLASICFNIFVICYIGETLTEQVLKHNRSKP
ncbi:uncharacterized protein LOC132907908 [Bombus pascuorum]|uniref:uncharacterized protein LOC132907908 n=1 Tax=Bombus pascuorum TaxID=65598 RepID=UPI00298E44D4|nr:uncharacterized protein LOC132907908 [Bombus pascuorum]